MTTSDKILTLGRYNRIKAEYEAMDKTDKDLKALYDKLNEFTKSELVQIAASIEPK